MMVSSTALNTWRRFALGFVASWPRRRVSPSRDGWLRLIVPFPRRCVVRPLILLAKCQMGTIQVRQVLEKLGYSGADRHEHDFANSIKSA
jgi:hypothetical protein